MPGASNPQAYNRYAYVLNNPLKYTDPTGHANYVDNDGGVCSNKPNGCTTIPINCSTTPSACGGGGGGGGGGGRPPIVITAPPVVIPAPFGTQNPYDLLSPFAGSDACNSLFSGQDLLCDLDTWRSFGTYIGGIPNYISSIYGFDPSRIDGIEVMVDLGGIVTDVGAVFSPAFKGQFIKAGLRIDAFGTVYQFTKAVEGDATLIDLGVDGAIEYVTKDPAMAARFGRTVPVVGIAGNFVSLGYNLNSAFYSKLPGD